MRSPIRCSSASGFGRTCFRHYGLVDLAGYADNGEDGLANFLPRQVGLLKHRDTPLPPSARRIEAFRGGSESRRPLHPAEVKLLWVLGAYLALLPWVLGTMHWPGQVASLGLAAAAFVLAVRPRWYVGRFSGDYTSFQLRPWLKLRRFPVFWLGLGLLAVVAVQALNPSWKYVETGKAWRLTRLPNVAWLPTGIAAPFIRFDAWRDLIIYWSVWLASCATWVGLTRRRSLRSLLLVVVFTGLAVGLLLLVQHVTGDTHFPWPLAEWTPLPLTGSFIYHNHAGAYFALVTFAAIALAMWHSDYGARMLKKSTPGAALSLAAVFLAGAVLFTLSRGAALSLMLSATVFIIWFLLRRRFQPATGSRNPGLPESSPSFSAALRSSPFVTWIFRRSMGASTPWPCRGRESRACAVGC